MCVGETEIKTLALWSTEDLITEGGGVGVDSGFKAVLLQ